MFRTANACNQLGRRLQDQGRHRLAAALYALASRLEPRWGAPWFNRGLLAKFNRRWPESFRYTLLSTELDPDFAPGWWNLGIAATAVGNWEVARRAWWRYGVKVPLGDGPPDMDLGLVPIRVAPGTAGEVLWCQRLDPARAQIRSVPLPGSGRAHGDLLLHDGEPKGTRMLGAREVPVFNELGLLASSSLRTFEVELSVPDPEAAAALERMAADNHLAAEDWSSVRMLCVQCSEGRPHSHHDTGDVWSNRRRFGIAAPEEASVVALLDAWVAAGLGRDRHGLTCVFARQ